MAETMRPFNHTSAPTLDTGLLKRLHRVDPDLFLTWSPYLLSTQTGQPIIGTYTGRPFHAPAFYLWINGTDGRCHFINSFKRFTHRNVQALEADAARFISPGEIIRQRLAAQEARTTKAHLANLERSADLFRENKSRIRRFMASEDISPAREARIFSYPNQPSRSTPGPVVKSATESGFVTK